MEMKQNETKQNTVTVLGTTINKGDNTDIMLMNIIQLLAEKEEIFLSNFLLQYKQDNEKETNELRVIVAEQQNEIEELEEIKEEYDETKEEYDELKEKMDDLEYKIEDLWNCIQW